MTAKAPSPAASDDVLRVLKAARKLIELPEDWCKSAYGFYSSPSCINGALARAAHYVDWCDVRDLLAAHLPKGQKYTHAFNDDPRTTHADVLALFDRAISSRLAEIEG